MDHHNYHHNYEPFNHFQYPHCPSAPGTAPELVSTPEPVPDSEPASYYHAPASPSDFIYNSANNTANNTASIFLPATRPSVRLSFNEPTSTLTLLYSQSMGYGPSRPVEQSFPTYLPSLPEPSLPEPAPGFEEHRRQRQRQSTMNMGPGQSKAVPPPLQLASKRGSSSNESTVVIRREEGSSSPVLVSIPQPMKKWEPRVPTGTEDQAKERPKPLGNMETEMEMNDMGSVKVSVSSIDFDTEIPEKWVNRGGVMERVVPLIHRVPRPAGWGVNMEMEKETTMPKMGLFRPVRWDDQSSRSSSKAKKARRARAWEVAESADASDVHFQRTLTYGTQNRKGIARSNSNRNQPENNETEYEDEQPATAPVSSSSHPHLSKRRKTSTSLLGPNNFRTASAATVATVHIKREPGLSPSPRATFAQIPMYSHSDPVTNNSSCYETAGGKDEDIPSSREISPRTKVPTPRRFLFPTSTSDRRQLKKRNREVAVFGHRGHRVGSRERSPEQRGEGFWNLASAGQGQNKSTEAVEQDQHQRQNRGSSSEEKGEEGWTNISISGSSEEGEVSSYYENSYSCGQERDDVPGARAGGIYQRQPHHFPSFSPSAQQPSSSSERYGPGHESEPSSLSASQEAFQERVGQYRQAIQVVQDTCLEASKRYIRAHCVNRGVRGGGGDIPDASSAPRETVKTRSARKVRRKRKLETRHGSLSSSSSSSFFSPSWQRRHRRAKGKHHNRTQRQKRTTTTPFSWPSSSSPSQEEITCTDSLLPNISQICTLLWSRSQSLRLHDTESIELHTARNMYWLLSWAETVAFAVAPTSAHVLANSFSNGTSETSVPGPGPGPDMSGVPLLEELGRREQWARPSPTSFPRRDLDPGWENVGDGLNDHARRWRETGSEESVEFEKLESRNDKVWEQQWQEMRRAFEEGGMMCEFLGYGEGVERLVRVREFYGF